MNYPIYTPDISRYTESLHKAIDGGWFSSQGEFIDKAVQTAKKVLGSPHVVLVNNGTSATHLLYKALKFKHPYLSKIYVPDYVFVAVWNAGLYEYPASMFSVLEIDPVTLNMRDDEAYIQTLDLNSAVVIVHNVGNIVNVPRLKRLRPDLIFVEDACEAFLESYEGKKTGTAALCAAVSFFANKIVTTGEGGMFYTNDKELYDFIYKSCHHGATMERYVYDVLGYNYRMTNLQAALLYDQLRDIDAIVITKTAVYERYVRLFGNAVSTTGIWMMILRIPGMRYEDFAAYARNRGVDTRPMFYPLSKHAHLQDIHYSPQHIGHEELAMIPSSPSLRPFDQTLIWSIIQQYNRGVSLDIRESTDESLLEFVSNTLPSTFRYFDSRTIDQCRSHQLSILGFVDSKPVAYAHIDDRWIGLCVLPEYQSKGYGRLMIEFVIAYARSCEIQPIRLSVDHSNTRARDMYIMYGFTFVRETPEVCFMEK